MTAREAIAAELDKLFGKASIEDCRDADSILSALDREGITASPKEPTEQMVEAAIAEAVRQGVALDDFSPPIFFAEIYKAMLSAHTKEQAK